jgi:molybdate transport system substrate-binding protein
MQIVLAAMLCAMSLVAPAAEIAVLSAGAVRAAFTEAAARWEKESGHRVKATFAPAGEILKRLAAGERFDLVILPAENFGALASQGLIGGPKRALGGVGIGVAVREGTPVPDISSPEAVRRLLVAAKSVTYMDPTRGTSGKFVDEVVLPKLGIRDEVRAKTIFGEGGYIADKVARGEVEVALHQYTEILPVKGVTPVGMLPAELQKVTVYTGAVTKAAVAAREAQALLDHLAAPEGQKAFAAHGFSTP